MLEDEVIGLSSYYSVAKVHVLELEVELLGLDGLNRGLEVVPLLARDTHLGALDARLHFELLVLDPLHDGAGVIAVDALFDRDADLRSALARRLDLARLDVLEAHLALYELLFDDVEHRLHAV